MNFLTKNPNLKKKIIGGGGGGDGGGVDGQTVNRPKPICLSTSLKLGA